MAELLPTCTIVHAMPGRVRLRVASRRGDAAYFATIAAGLSAHPGVSAVEVAPLTGSILIRHRAPLAEIEAVAEKAGLFRVEVPAPPPPVPPLAIPKLATDTRLAVAAGLGVIALWQLGQGKFLPPAVTLLWYASRVAGVFGSRDPSPDDAE